MSRSSQIFNLLTKSAGPANSSGFLVPQSAFDRALDAKLDSFLAELPVGEEMFNADLARRGIFGSGEAPKEMYRSVYAPIARAGTSAIAESMLSYQQMRQQGLITAEGFRQQGLNRLAGIYGQELAMENQPPWWGELVGTGLGIGALALMGGLGGGAAAATTAVA